MRYVKCINPLTDNYYRFTLGKIYKVEKISYAGLWIYICDDLGRFDWWCGDNTFFEDVTRELKLEKILKK